MISFILPQKPRIEIFHQYLAESIKKDHYTNFGSNHNLLLQKFSEIVGTDKIVLTANATLILDGLHDILSRKCGLAYLPSFTFPATNQGCRVATIYGTTISGGKDIGRAQWDCNSYTDTYAVSVNPFGSLAEPQRKPNTAYWIVDNAAGLLSQSKDWLEAGADAVVYSLHATKILSACEGGLVVFKNDNLYKEYCEYINFGFKVSPDGSRITGICGSNHKMSELSAAWCLMNLHELDTEIEKREEISNSYKEFCDIYKIPHIYSLQAFWLLGIKDSTEMQKFAAEKHHIDIRPYYQTLQDAGRCHVTKRFNQKGFCLPTRSTLTKQETKSILMMLQEAKDLNMI